MAHERAPNATKPRCTASLTNYRRRTAEPNSSRAATKPRTLTHPDATAQVRRYDASSTLRRKFDADLAAKRTASFARKIGELVVVGNRDATRGDDGASLEHELVALDTIP